MRHRSAYSLYRTFRVSTSTSEWKVSCMNELSDVIFFSEAKMFCWSRSRKGEVQFKCEVNQVGLVRFSFDNIKVSLPRELDDIYGKEENGYFFVYYFSKETEVGSQKKTSTGRREFEDLEPLYVRASYGDLMPEFLVFEMKKKRTGGDDDVAVAKIPMVDHHSLQDDDPVEFRMPLELKDLFLQEHRLDYPDAGTLEGTVSFTGFPKYLQMESGYCTDKGIYYAFFKDSQVIHKPNVYIHGMDDAEASNNPSDGIERKPGTGSDQNAASDTPTSTVQYPFAHLLAGKKAMGDSQNYFESLTAGGSKSQSQEKKDDISQESKWADVNQVTQKDASGDTKAPPTQEDGGGTESSPYPFAHLLPTKTDASNSVAQTNDKEKEDVESKAAAAPYPFAHLIPESNNTSGTGRSSKVT